MTNPHEILGVEHDADFDTIKRAYLKRAKAAHPDAGGSTEEFVQLQTAFEMMATTCGSRTRTSRPHDDVAEDNVPQGRPSQTYGDFVQDVWNQLDRRCVQSNRRRESPVETDFWFAVIFTPLCAGTIATWLCYDGTMPERPL
jgi:DnaJ-class molecular chaperone